MQSSLLATVLCFLCHATWTAAAAPPAIAQISPPPNISPRPTLTSDRLPSPVTVLEEMASFGIDGTRNVVYAEVMLSETLKPADVKNTLRTANATALRKDPRIQLSHFNPFKVKVCRLCSFKCFFGSFSPFNSLPASLQNGQNKKQQERNIQSIILEEQL